MLFTGVKWSAAVNGPVVLLNLPRSSLLVSVFVFLIFFYLSGNFEGLASKCICVCVSLYVSAWLNSFFFFFSFVGECLVVRKICVWILGCSFVRFLKHVTRMVTRLVGGVGVYRTGIIMS